MRLISLAAVTALSFLASAEAASGPAILPTTFAGITLGQSRDKISKLLVLREIGGRGCDYYHGTITFHKTRFKLELGFDDSGPKGRLAEINFIPTALQAKGLQDFFEISFSKIERITDQGRVFEDDSTLVGLTRSGSQFGFGMVSKMISCEGQDFIVH